MKNEINNISFPNPPFYYKEFKDKNHYNPPDINILNKMGSFTTFGEEYKTKDINLENIKVDIKIKDKIPKRILKNIDIPNKGYFEELQNNNNISNKEDINIINEFQKEILFLKERYKMLLNNIENSISSCDNEIILITISIQKIIYYLNALRKKMIIQKHINFIKNEINKNKEVEENFLNNKAECLSFLKENFENKFA